MLRPLFHDFEGEFDDITDQFLIGPNLMQAPFLEEIQPRRKAILPGEEPWFDARDGAWRKPGTTTLRNSYDATPLFIRSGAMVPMRPGLPSDNKTDLRRPEVHLFFPTGWKGRSEIELVADDGESYGYRRGKRSRMTVNAQSDGGEVQLSTRQTQSGFGVIRPRFVLHGARRPLTVDGRRVKMTGMTVRLTGKTLRAWRVGA